MLIASCDKKEIDVLKSKLDSEFEMKHLGNAKKMLDIEILRNKNDGTLFLNQRSYIRKILEKFRMNQAKGATTPMDSHFKLSVAFSPSEAKEQEKMENILYSNVVGSVMYCMVCTRPDLTYSASMVSRYMANPGKMHWYAAKWILRYLKQTKRVGLLFTKTELADEALVGYVDLDFAGDLDKRRSLTGYIFTLYGNVMSWKASLQHVVALSSTEAEYIALTDAVKKLCGSREL